MARLDNAECSEWAFNNPISGILPPALFLIYLIYLITVKDANLVIRGYIFALMTIWATLSTVSIYFGFSPDRGIRRLVFRGDSATVDNCRVDFAMSARSIGKGTSMNPNWISLRGTDFELWLQDLYQSRGYEVMHNGGQKDHGADLILQKGGRTIVVQAKGYGDKVKKDAVNEAHTAQSIYQANEAWVVTNNYFTDYTREHAKACEVRLYDRNSLDRYLRTGRQYQGHRR